jgi:hypothetical protein
MSARYTIDSILLAFRELKGSHTGKNIAGVIKQVLGEYGISKTTIGTFILDNAPTTILALIHSGRVSSGLKMSVNNVDYAASVISSTWLRRPLFSALNLKYSKKRSRAMN